MAEEHESLPNRVAKPLKAAFLNHPESIGETYFQHQRQALGFAGSLTIAATAAFVHSLVPCLCEKTASERIAELHGRLQSRTPGRKK